MAVSGRRLEFERNVWKEVAAPSRLRERPRRRALVSVVTAITVLAVLGLGLSAAAGSVWFVFGLSDRSALAHMSTVLLVGLQANDMSAASSACAEGETGVQALDQEDAKAFLTDAPSPGADPATNRRARIESLAVLRERLAEIGVRWDDVVPLAFGGVRARVKDPSLMNRPVTAVTGYLYFASGGRLFALELSARKCANAYFITEIWDWANLDTPPTLEAAEERSSEAFRSFKNTEEDASSGAAEISQERSLFVKL